MSSVKNFHLSALFLKLQGDYCCLYDFSVNNTLVQILASEKSTLQGCGLLHELCSLQKDLDSDEMISLYESLRFLATFLKKYKIIDLHEQYPLV